MLHRDLGLWAVDSVNANSCNTLSSYLDKSMADVVLAQEVKLVAGDSLTSAEPSLATRAWRARIQPCTLGPAGGLSAGTLVGVRHHIGMAGSFRYF